jgi:hypothetical protein
VELDDKKWIEPILASTYLLGCHYSFVNLFSWASVFKYQVAQADDFLVVKGVTPEGTPYYFYPAGRGNPQSVIEAMFDDAANSKVEFRFAGLSVDNTTEVESLFPGKFEFFEDRDSFDYVYRIDDLVNLAGGKYRAKRNHINHFKKHNTWSFEQISLSNLDECWDMNTKWCKIHECKYNIPLTYENCAVRCCFEHFAELGLEGGLLRSEGKVVAYTMGKKLNSDTYDINIEKAFDDIQGAYQMINREFAALIRKSHPELVYINREEDMGQEGLRKAKLSYRPVRMVEKYSGKVRGD